MCVANLVTARAAIVQHRPGRPAIRDIKNAHTPVAIRQPVYAQKQLNTGVPLDIMAHPVMVRPVAHAVQIAVHPRRAQRQSRRVICRPVQPAATVPVHIHIRLIVITVTSYSILVIRIYKSLSLRAPIVTSWQSSMLYMPPTG